jgi:hypothetical protein
MNASILNKGFALNIIVSFEGTSTSYMTIIIMLLLTEKMIYNLSRLTKCLFAKGRNRLTQAIKTISIKVNDLKFLHSELAQKNVKFLLH